MKRFLIAFYILSLAINCVGCAKKDAQAAPAGHSFTYNETVVSLNTDAAPILAALGEPQNYTEEENAALEGLEKTYFYGSFYLTTRPVDGIERIHSICFVDAGAVTDEGIHIGSPQEDVDAAYGSRSFNGINTYTVIDENTQLTIILIDGLVSSIQYKLIN